MSPDNIPLTLDRILATAEDVIRRFGPAKATVVDVARALGVSHAAVYRHVADVLRLPPDALLSVGDDSRNDVEGPRKAGWRAVQIERPKRDLWAAVRALSKR